MKKGILSLLFGCLFVPLIGQISITSPAFTYTEDIASNAVPTGWAFFETGSNNNLTFTTGTGTASTGDTYFLGTANYAFGGLQSGSLIPTVGLCFTNNSTQILSSISISYVGETWRVGAASRSDKLSFQINTNTTAINGAGTWTPITSLDYANPGQALGSGSVQHSATITNTISGLSIAAGTTFCFRWVDFNATGSDDAMGIASFTVTSIVLPLELTTFSAQKSANKNDLAWQTASETNVSNFDIQRSNDGQKWQSIGEVKAVGNTRDVQNYSFSDENPLQISYYRLRSVDFDGAEQFSGVERVVREGAVKTAYVLPTSVQDAATVVMDSDIETATSLTIFDQTGRQISTQTANLDKGENRISLEVNHLPQGIYTIRFGQNEATPLRFVKK